MDGSRLQLVVIGGGMAAGRFVERLVAWGFPGRITVISEEGLPAYNRVLLPEVISGRCQVQELADRSLGWWADHGISVLSGLRVTRIDRENRRVQLSTGRCIAYDRLVLATGSAVDLPRMPGLLLPGVSVLRTAEDALRLRRIARNRAPVTIVGGGLLGLEAAQAFIEAGTQVRIVHRGDRLMNRQLDRDAARIVRDSLQSRGVECLLGTSVTAIRGRNRVHRIECDGGELFESSAVLLATGHRPRDDLARDAGLDCDRGVTVDCRLATADPDIFALGGCASVERTNFAFLEPVYRQADTLAANFCGGNERFSLSPAPVVRLKLSGLNVCSIGQHETADDSPTVRVERSGRSVYRRLLFAGRKLAGAILVGDTSGVTGIQRAIGTVMNGAADLATLSRLCQTGQRRENDLAAA